MTLFLAIDGGGTRTRAGLYDADRALLAETTGPGSNPVIHGLDACVGVIAGLGRELLRGSGAPFEAVAAAVAGLRRSGMAQPVADALRAALGARRAVVSNDLQPLLFANAGAGPGVLAIAGTGSSVTAQSGDGRSVLVGGRGIVFGDDGSAYQIAVSALRAAACAVDGLGPATALDAKLPRALGLETFADLVVWVLSAPPASIAGLAAEVARVADAGDAVAARCIEEQAARLAAQVLAAADRAGLPDDAPVFLNGGVAEQCARYLDALRRAVGATRLAATPALAPLRGHRAALEMAFVDRLPAGLHGAISPAPDA